MADLLNTSQLLEPGTSTGYIDHHFNVPPDTNTVRVTFSYTKKGRTNIMISLHDQNGFRGSAMNSFPFKRDRVDLELWVASDSASEGAIPGPTPAGNWRVQVDVETLGAESEYQLKVEAALDPSRLSLPLASKIDGVVRDEPGWYRGELHAHSRESDGREPLEETVRVALGVGLEFLALTEHNTHSHWHKLPALLNDRIALIYSYEVTSHQGHANLHGLSEWIDPFIDRPGWDMNLIADEVHAQGGLFCVNHPFSGALGWRVDDFDWEKADLLEIYHNLEGANNNFHGPLWDHHLRLGRRIVGVGGIDSHDPSHGLHRLGQLHTWIYAPALSEAGILEGLRGGRVYVSRGPKLQFTSTTDGGKAAEMGEVLKVAPGNPVEFQLGVSSTKPLLAHLLKNGYPFETRHIESTGDGWGQCTFQDTPKRSGYYRIELHDVVQDSTYKGIEWRDHLTMRALSNPIWVTLR